LEEKKKGLFILFFPRKDDEMRVNSIYLSLYISRFLEVNLSARARVVLFLPPHLFIPFVPNPLNFQNPKLGKTKNLTT